MSHQTLVWTALPNGYAQDGALRLSIVISPRLAPASAAEQRLGAPAFADFHNWPKTLERIKFALRIGTRLCPAERISETDAALWDTLLGPDTPVAGFAFTDMSRVNLRSYPVRNVVRFLRQHYGTLAQQSPNSPPVLLPWPEAHPGLRDMLADLGTPESPGRLGHGVFEFDRFLAPAAEKAPEAQIDRMVFDARSRQSAPRTGLDGSSEAGTFPLRALPPDWHEPVGNRPDSQLMGLFRSAAEYSFYQANRFYRRRPATAAELALRRPDLKSVPPPPPEPEYDFHRILASYADTPQVLRALGLIIDVVLPPDNPIEEALRTQRQAGGVLGVELQDWDGHDLAPNRCPRTAWQATHKRFVTQARTRDHTDGLLRLESARDSTFDGNEGRGNFEVFQLDVDGAALKTVNFLLSAQKLIADSDRHGTDGAVTYGSNERQGLAALRSGGLGIARHGRAVDVALSAAAAALKNEAIASSAEAARRIVLYAEDVLRGYRVDVQAREQWQSLCARTAEATVLRSGQPLPLAPDEGYVKGASTTGDGGDDHYLHEALFRWTGWSLAAPRPGRTIKAVEHEGSGLQGESVEEITAVGERGNGLTLSFAVAKGTLPRLRFGWNYRLRARVVDLAGNSLATDDGSLGATEQATERVPYLRFEPVDPPVLVHAHRVSEGESLERLVLRSNAGVTPTAYLDTPDFEAATQEPASADFEYQATSARHVVPPKSSQLQCEQHGLFDDAMGSDDAARVKAAYAVAAREAGTLFDDLPGSQVELVTPSGAAPAALTESVPPKAPDADHPTGERLVGGQYVVHREWQLTTPYLPDGLAAGIAIRGETHFDMGRVGVHRAEVLGPDAVVLPVAAGAKEVMLLIRHHGRWPDTRGLRIVLAERDSAPAIDDATCTEEAPSDADRPLWDAEQRVLTLFVRKGRIARLRYASFVDPGMVRHLALPAWGDSAGARQALVWSALMGLHWMLTPYRPLVLVHATQQPVCTPRLTRITAQRDVGSTFVDLNARVQMHGPSTGKFELEAEWDEWLDDLNQPRPEQRHMRGALAEIPLPENHVNNFGLAPQAQAQRAAPATPGGSGAARALGNRHEFGDTRFRLVRYRVRATTRFREYLPPALYAQAPKVTRTGPYALESQALLGADGDPGAPVRFNVAGAQPNGTLIRNSAVPDVPDIVYVVPTMSWQRELGAGKARQTSTRAAGGLRVYLQRPWFSSGDGELLGVVLHADKTPDFRNMRSEVQPFVTQWGLDPLFDSHPPNPQWGVNAFPTRVASETVPLIEVTGAKVHVVGHRVQWDDARQLWFADLDLDIGASYLPFVRLALARYQPHSLAGTKISRTVLAEFAQLLPRRRAVVTATGSDAFQVTLHGPVPAYGPMRLQNDSAYENISFVPRPGEEIESGRNRVELVLQQRDAALDSDLAWSDVAVLGSGPALPPGMKADRMPGRLDVTHTPLVTGAAERAGRTAVASQVRARAGATPVTRRGRLGEALQFEREVVITRPPIGEWFDPPIWQTSVQLPIASGNAPRRLVMREFERYYADRSVDERRGSRTYKRRVVEERLVYSEFFPL